MSKEREDGEATRSGGGWRGRGRRGGAWRRGLGAAGWKGLDRHLCPDRPGTGSSACVPLAGGGGGGRGVVWGLGYPARVTRSILFAGAGGALGRPSRPERRGCVWGYKAACLRLDATARRAGAGRGGRRQRGGSATGICDTREEGAGNCRLALYCGILRLFAPCCVRGTADWCGGDGAGCEGVARLLGERSVKSLPWTALATPRRWQSHACARTHTHRPTPHMRCPPP